MKRFFKKIWHNKKGFTLLECVLAVAILGVTSGMLYSLLSMGVNFTRRSGSMQQMTAKAQEMIIVYNTDTTVNNNLKRDANSGYLVGYSDELDVIVEFQLLYPDEKDCNITCLPSAETFHFVAAIVKDTGLGARVVFYDISPSVAKDLFKE